MEPEQINPTPLVSQPKQSHKIFYILIFIFVALVGVSSFWRYPSEILNFFGVKTPQLCIPDCGAVSHIVDETSNWKTYRNEDYWFEVKIPSDWVVETLEDLNSSSEINFFSPKNKLSLDKCRVDTLCGGETIFANIKFGNQDFSDGDVIISSSTRMLNGIEFYTYYLGGLYEYFVYQVKKDNEFYSFLSMKEEEILNFLSTFKFIDQITIDLEGYYIQEEQTAWEETLLCDKFVVTGGNSVFIDGYISSVKSGNTVNHIDDQGNLVLNLDLSGSSLSLKSKITSSNSNKKIDIRVSEKKPFNSGVGACFSFINVLE